MYYGGGGPYMGMGGGFGYVPTPMATPMVTPGVVPGPYPGGVVTTGTCGGRRHCGRPTWMPLPKAVTGLDRPLWYLAAIDYLVIDQLMELYEMITGYETANKYAILNRSGQQVYYAFERHDPFTAQVAGQLRPFTIHVVDNAHREVIRIHRPYQPMLSRVIIECPPGHMIGEVVEERNFVSNTRFHLCSTHRGRMGYVVAPIQVTDIHDDFMMYNNMHQTMGHIQKLYGGPGKEIHSDADTFAVTFPMALDAVIKAATIACTFLIDFIYYENNNCNPYARRR